MHRKYTKYLITYVFIVALSKLKRSMKNTLLVCFICFTILSCSKSDDTNSNCNYLLNVGVNTSVNLNLFPYTNLQFVSNSEYVPNVGNGGIIVTNTGTGFRAWDASDPNHTPSACSVMEIVGIEGVCGCADENTYSLFTGQPLGNPDLRCGLKAYNVQQNGNELIIFN